MRGMHRATRDPWPGGPRVAQESLKFCVAQEPSFEAYVAHKAPEGVREAV